MELAHVLKNSVIRMPLRAQILLRNRLNMRKYPVGVDIDGNVYFDNGCMRKVENPSGNPVSLVVVMPEYSDWLCYKRSEFPVIDKSIYPCPNSSHELVYRTSEKSQQEIARLNQLYSLYIKSMKVGGRMKTIYKPDSELVVFIHHRL